MNPSDFESLVISIGFSPVPKKFQPLISNVALTIEDEPSADKKRKLGLAFNQTLLGLYEGVPRTARGQSYGIAGPLPDKITLYRLPILKMAEEGAMSVRMIIEETIWHEVAHHFGLNEKEVRKRQKEKTEK